MSTHPQAAPNGDFSQANPLDFRNTVQEEYGQHPNAWFDWVFDALKLPERGAVLDLGCGSGAFWQHNQSRIPAEWDLYLSDRSDEMVCESRARLIEHHPHAHFFRADCQTIPFETQRAEAVLAIGLLDLVADINTALSEIRRVLRPGGLLVATAGGKNHLREMEELLRPFVPAAKAQQLGGNDARFGIENGEQWLAKQFSAVTRRDYRDQLVFTNAHPVADYILSELELARAVPGKDLLTEIQRKIQQKGELRVSVQKGLFLAR